MPEGQAARAVRQVAGRRMVRGRHRGVRGSPRGPQPRRTGFLGAEALGGLFHAPQELEGGSGPCPQAVLNLLIEKPFTVGALPD